MRLKTKEEVSRDAKAEETPSAFADGEWVKLNSW